MVKFIKKLAGSKGSESNCCRVEIKEVEEVKPVADVTTAESCCGSTASDSCCSTNSTSCC